MSDPSFVLVHGAWHGGWAWAPVAQRLQEAGREVHVVDLPSSGDDPHALGGLVEDTAVVRAAVEVATGPVVLVGHSYGGIPITELGAVDGAAHLVYVAAFMLDVGESLFSALGGQAPPWIGELDDAPALVANEGERVFYADVDDDALVRQSLARLQPQSVASFATELTTAGWHELPSTYVLCEQDQAIPPPAQEQMSQRAGAVHRLASSHSPFLSMPDRVTELLLAVEA